MVARLIAARTNLGMRRQILFCSVGGYDTHDGECRESSKQSAALDRAAEDELMVAPPVVGARTNGPDDTGQGRWIPTTSVG
jgi:uncharacterized protein (DUF1501 family)